MNSNLKKKDNINENINVSGRHELEDKSNLSNNIFEEIENDINKNKSSIYNKLTFVHSKNNIIDDEECKKLCSIIISSNVVGLVLSYRLSYRAKFYRMNN